MKNIWQELDHESIFKAIEATLGAKLTSLLIQRNSYINRVYELEKQDGKERFISKFYRPGRWTKEMILEEHGFLKELEEKDVPVISPIVFSNRTLFSLGDISYAIFQKKGGRAVDEFDKDSWENLGRHLARIHSAGALHKSSRRILWRPGTATKHHIKVLHGTDFLPKDFRKPFDDAAELFIKKFDKLFDNNGSILIHGDCHKGNLINRPGEGIWIIDFDDICMGPPVQDLWMLLPGGVEDSQNELEWFLKGYETYRPFDIGSLALIPALRGMRMIHFVSWLAVQSKDPHFSKHFPETGSPRYWNELIKELQQIVYNNP
jgi:Ser/Thr protein kinase RdoA (MazF antagonist)